MSLHKDTPFLDFKYPDLGHFQVCFYYQSANEAAHQWPIHVDDSVELFVLEQGDISFFVGGNHYDMLPGDVILVKPNEIHNCIQNSPGVHNHFCFWFSTRCKRLLSDFMLHEDGTGNLIRFPDDKKQEFLALCHKIHETATEGNSVSVYSLAIAILEFCRGELGSLQKSQDMPPELLDFLHKMELKTDIFPNVKELCDELFITPSTALRLFRKYLGVSPRQYLEIRRLDIARKHLREGKSVTDTALLVGYADTSAFIRLFHRHFGFTPLKYQQKKSD